MTSGIRIGDLLDRFVSDVDALQNLYLRAVGYAHVSRTRTCWFSTSRTPTSTTTAETLVTDIIEAARAASIGVLLISHRAVLEGVVDRVVELRDDPITPALAFARKATS